MRTVGILSLFAGVALVATSNADAQSPAGPLAPRSQGWLVSSPSEINVAAPPDGAELAELKAIMAKRTDADLMRLRWWAAGGPTYRWNELALAAMLEDFVTLPLAARHLALLHAAMDDAVAIAWAHKRAFRRPRPHELDPSLATALSPMKGPSYPSDVAAAATAASEVLGYVLPVRAQTFAAQAEEAMQSRLLAGVEYPSDIAAGREIGRKVAALAIARGKADGSDGKWTGSVPQGPGRWQGTTPIGATTATWQPWVLARADEFRPPAPPAFDSDQTKAALAELKSFKRIPNTSHRAVYWEVFGGARAHVLWNEVARIKLLEYGDAFDAPAAARALAALNIAFADSAVACWDAKFAYWHIRPSQLDAELKPLFPPPNHPSYPAAHGCLSTAAAVVLAHVFPADRERLLAMGTEAAEARIWAGIHYRYDIDAGQELGRKVADKTLARAFTTTKP